MPRKRNTPSREQILKSKYPDYYKSLLADKPFDKDVLLYKFDDSFPSDNTKLKKNKIVKPEPDIDYTEEKSNLPLGDRIHNTLADMATTTAVFPTHLRYPTEEEFLAGRQGWGNGRGKVLANSLAMGLTNEMMGKALPMVADKASRIPGITIDDPERGFHALNKDHWALHPNKLTEPLDNLTKTEVDEYLDPVINRLTNTQILGLYGEAALNRLMPIINKTPLIHPTRKVAENIMRYAPAPTRSISEIRKSLFGKEIKQNGIKLKKYQGLTGNAIQEIRFGNKTDLPQRDLIKLYLYGDDKAFEKAPSDILMQSWGDRYNKLYPNIKKYILKSDTPHGSDVSMDDVMYRRMQGIRGVDDGYGWIIPYDDIGGHLEGIIKNKSNNDVLVTQDLWKMNPRDYSNKWNRGSEGSRFTKLQAEKQAGLLDKVGKPFTLVQNNPVKKVSREQLDIKDVGKIVHNLKNPPEEISFDYSLGSWLGDNSSIFTNMASGAASGALAGAPAGGLGALPGAIIGGVGGLISGIGQSVRDNRQRKLEKKQMAASIAALDQLQASGIGQERIANYYSNPNVATFADGGPINAKQLYNPIYTKASDAYWNTPINTNDKVGQEKFKIMTKNYNLINDLNSNNVDSVWNFNQNKYIKRNLPPADDVLNEISTKVQSLPNEDAVKLMQIDWMKKGFNVGDIPTVYKAAKNADVSLSDMYRYYKHFQGLMDKNYTYANGGPVTDSLYGMNNIYTEYKGGGTHQQNSLGGIPVGAKAKVEENEVRFDDPDDGSSYIFSDRY